MEQWILDYIKTFDMFQILAIGIIIWVFYNRLDRKLDKMDDKIEKQGKRTDKLYELFIKQQRNFDKKFYDLLKSKNPKTDP